MGPDHSVPASRQGRPGAPGPGWQCQPTAHLCLNSSLCLKFSPIAKQRYLKTKLDFIKIFKLGDATVFFKGEAHSRLKSKEKLLF